MKIRKMEISDYKSVYNLWISCKGMGLNDVDDSEKGISRFLERNPETCFVAVDNDEIIGVILCGNDGRRGYIYHTAVKPSERNKGIGTKLVDRAMKAFENIGITKVALVVFEKNETGNTFWEKKGFMSRKDLVYRNKQITEMIRIDT